MAEKPDVTNAWKHNRVASHNNFMSTGADLYSYELRIGYTAEGKKVVIDFTKEGGRFISQTTSKHVGEGKKVADVVIKPAVLAEAAMRVPMKKARK